MASVLTIPPLCPGCGSHRTQVVGSVDQTAGRRIRCLTCEQMWVLIANEPSTRVSATGN
jgi:hypothetical protein